MELKNLSKTPVLATVTESKLGFRSGYGKNYDLIAELVKGTTVVLTSVVKKDNNSLWGETTHAGRTGWICIKADGKKFVSADFSIIAKTTSTPMKDSSDDTKVTQPKNDIDKVSSKGLEGAFNKMMTNSLDAKLNRKYGSTRFRGSMRLFGLPYQFTSYVDNRIPEVHEHLGRKFIENIILEAPIVTLIPGKPKYLPGAKDKRGTTQALVSAAGGNFTELASLSASGDNKYMRYFDFQQDYLRYMQYVNILCRTVASFLDLGDETLDGVPLSQYDWKNYRFTSSSYSSMAGSLLSAGGKAAKNAATSFVEAVGNFGSAALEAIGIQGTTKAEKAAAKAAKANKASTYSNNSQIQFDEEMEDGMLEALESALKNMNYLQIFVDPSSGVSESLSNTTSQSKIESMLESGSETAKELAYLVNAGGANGTQLTEMTGEGMNELITRLTASSTGTVSGIMERIVGVTSSIIKGENIIMPEIYQNSEYGKSYSIKMNLKTVYANKYSYYMDVLVPYLHILALVAPKQGTANTYSSPFIVKVSMPGVFNCNLGIIESLTVEKNASGDAWSVDGLPSEIDLTLNIKDLYSDLMLSPSTDALLFMSNTSLIEFLAVTCGLDLVQPQIQDKVEMAIGTLQNAITDVGENIKSQITAPLDRLINNWFSLN